MVCGGSAYYEICPNAHLTICWLSPESFSFPDQKKSDVFSPVELLMPGTLLSACAVAHGKSRLMLSFQQWAQEQHPEPALPAWIPVLLYRGISSLPGSPGWRRSCSGPSSKDAQLQLRAEQEMLRGAGKCCELPALCPVLLGTACLEPKLGRTDRSVKGPFKLYDCSVLFVLWTQEPCGVGFFPTTCRK